jgi:hypothetical protein
LRTGRDAARGAPLGLAVVGARTWRPLFEFDVPDGGRSNQLAFSADGTKLAMMSVHRRLFVRLGGR